jgi:hypothetical protein
VLSVGQERTFTATALTPGVEYRITLVETRTTSTATGPAGGDGTLRLHRHGRRPAGRGRLLRGPDHERQRPPGGGRHAEHDHLVPDVDGAVNVTVKGNRDTDDVVAVFYPNTGRSPRLELAGDLRPSRSSASVAGRRSGRRRPRPARPARASSRRTTARARSSRST